MTAQERAAALEKIRARVQSEYDQADERWEIYARKGLTAKTNADYADCRENMGYYAGLRRGMDQVRDWLDDLSL